jgi:hypothetical protein
MISFACRCWWCCSGTPYLIIREAKVFKSTQNNPSVGNIGGADDRARYDPIGTAFKSEWLCQERGEENLWNSRDVIGCAITSAITNNDLHS